ncbi:hypothetical protein ACPPVU_05500 [Mucilaginibacter sp. McL0603]|uniref:hypothetical protein n=1 Tax=Mucilaginibacter sp. McL0603 TaxID=3415670 RepID=UPI003CF89307
MQTQNLFRGIFSCIILSAYLIINADNCLAQITDTALSASQIAEIQRKNGLDPITPLSMRIRDASASVIKLFREAGMSPSQHQLTGEERLKVSKAFAVLPPLHQRVLRAHLRSINFLDNMPNTALTSLVNHDDQFKLYDITFRAAILKQNLSQWITEKERSCFKGGDSSLNVSIMAGELDAIAYVLMHEATHVVDGSLGILPNNTSKKSFDSLASGSFTTGIWLDRTTIAAKFRDSLLDSTRFRPGGKVLPLDRAVEIYRALGRTPFVSLYSTSSQHEDLAEFVTVYDLTQKLKQPFRIVIRKNGKDIFSYEPMKSKLVQSRGKYLSFFYSDI